ncbi:GNAT family N-acetyltransferase [Sneathiella chinensis]|uniref:N-acetyltransferase n=1 Tax=Sneathiella chinensis TaxID=349750 RepID=A0ABQ5U7P9_9PROT|nr:GNAT family N-acetyltransferase [Sneathiella chinensis]GLQ07299.1 N-acetyltransferase [Sneathiella chinensis]
MQSQTPARLVTKRLILRQWQDSDLVPFAALNADPAVMEFFPHCLTREDSDAMALKIRTLIAEQGWGFWAAEIRDTGAFAGFVGLHRPSADLPFSPCVEIGWRLARDHWGQGLATEGAKAALTFAFDRLSLPEVVSFTFKDNHRSRAVMERLGFQNSGEDFNHPALPDGHPLRPHVLYRLQKPSP